MIVEKEKASRSGFEPLSFERPSSRAYWYSKRWSCELPDSARLSVRLGAAGLRAMNRTLESGIVERDSRAVFERLCEATEAVVHISPFHSRKKQVKGFIAYSDSIWDRAFEARLIKSTRVHRQPGALSTIRLQSAEPFLRDLEAMANEQDEPDFLNRPTPYAYETAKEFIKSAYTHYVGTAPLPTLGPDGNGGMVVEWQSDQRTVRLVVAPDKNAKTYIYRRANDESAVDHVPSGAVLAQRLLGVFR